MPRAKIKRDVKKWDRRFLEMAQFVSCWSKDPSTKVGAVIADDKRRVVSVGYNGLPMGVEDTDERLQNRDIKYKLIVHGERNAILFAQRSVQGCTLYTWPFMPCATCASMVIQAGITRVVAPYSDNPRWQDDFKLTEQLFEEAGVKLVLLSSDYDIVKVVFDSGH
jgi:dCMP deaminase